MSSQQVSRSSMSRPLQEPEPRYAAFMDYAADVLIARSSYKSCHILTADHKFRLPAIQVGRSFYSFFRVLQAEDEAIATLKRLDARGDIAMVTIIPKGFAIWILESGAIALASHRIYHGSAPLDATSGDRNATRTDLNQSDKSQNPCKILTSRKQYTTCKARIKGLDRPVSVVCYEGQYYCLFKTVQDIKQAAEIVKRISRRGNCTVVTRMPQGYGVWILEAHAKPIDSF